METVPDTQDLIFVVSNAVNNDVLYRGSDPDDANDIIGELGQRLPMLLQVFDKANRQNLRHEQLVCADRTRLN